MRGICRFLIGAWVFLGAIAMGRPSVSGAVVAEAPRSGHQAARSGLLPGDVLKSWRRPSSSRHQEGSSGTFQTPFDVYWVATEQAPRGAVEVEGEREGHTFRQVVPDGGWQFPTRPVLSPVELALYRQVGGEPPDLGALRRLGEQRRRAGDPAAALWALERLAQRYSQNGRPEEAQAVWRDAIRKADTWGLQPCAVWLWRGLGEALLQQGEIESAAAVFQEAIRRQEGRPGEELILANLLVWAMEPAWRTGDLSTAEALTERAGAIYRRLAPQSFEASMNLANEGLLAGDRGNLTLAEQRLRAALAIQESLEIGPFYLGRTWTNLASTLAQSREYDLAQEYFRKAHEAFQRSVPGSHYLVGSLHNQSELALLQGDLPAAYRHGQAALATVRDLAPDSILEATVLSLLARISLVRGEMPAAEVQARRGLALWQELAPRSIGTMECVDQLAQIAEAQGQIREAEGLYRDAVRWLDDRMPEAHCQSCYRLGVLLRRSGHHEEARQYLHRAVDTLEGQREQLSASPEATAQFAAEFANYYRELLSLLVEDGEPEEAFLVLERYRARSFRSFLAERSLSLQADIPEALERERLLANSQHDRLLGELAQGVGGGAAEAVLRRKLREARRRQDDVAAKIRSLVPRLAALRYPEPLNLRQVQGALDPGTLLLSYSIGPESGFLFAVGPEEGSLEVFPVPLGEVELGEAVQQFRSLVERGRIDRRPGQILTASRRLSGQLLGSVAPRIARAERLLILADGPLHALPFGALADPGEPSPHRYLIEGRPVVLAASATLFALTQKERRPRGEIRLVAFGDPLYARAGARESAAPAWDRAVRGGLSLAPLPGSREEVERLRQLFPDQSRIYLGAAATEERAKGESRAASWLHFACHGFLDEESPLDSGLALSIPTTWQPDQENGLLQGWEILEQMRLDAELVTLSACDTGLGKVLGGEGLLGLSRAFQYAGARTMVVTLWGVNDRSTSRLMEAFYGHLRSGQNKAEALRRAQRELIADQDFAHPFYWAGFQLLGDWY